MSRFAFFDIHAHLHDAAYDEDRDVVLAEMKSYGVGAITIGTALKESRDAVALAEAHDHIYASIGLHPADNVVEDFDEAAFSELAKSSKVVAIGECGLDYHYVDNFFERDKKEKGLTHSKEEEIERQKRVFREQIAFAVNVNKPLMLHGRPSKNSMNAYEDMLTILEEAKKEHGNKVRGNAHFFVGTIDIAQRFINIGFTVSFPGVITFAKEYDDVVRFMPLTLVHAETDSPYASPIPYRGKRNSPMYVQEVVAKIAVLREQSMEEVRMQLLENVKRTFDLTF